MDTFLLHHFPLSIFCTLTARTPDALSVVCTHVFAFAKAEEIIPNGLDNIVKTYFVNKCERS